MTSDTQNNRAGDQGLFRAYLREFLRFDPPTIRRAALLNIISAGMEGAGLLMLLPLLTLAGVFDTEDSSFTVAHSLLSSLKLNWDFETALVFFVTLIAVQAWLMLLRDRVCRSLQLRFADHLKQRLYDAVAHSRWSYLTGRHSGEILNVLTSEVQRIGIGTYFLLRLSTLSLLALAYLSVAFRMSPPLALLALGTGLLLWLLLRSTDRASRESGILLGQANRDLLTRTQDFLSALKLIKIHGEEASHICQFNDAVTDVSRRFIDFQKSWTRAQMAYRMGGAVALAILSYSALTLMALTPARLLVMIAIFARMLPHLSEIAGGRQQLLHMLPAFSAWQNLLAACMANRDFPPARDEPAPLQDRIVLGRVAFRHPQSHLALTVEHLAIPAKKTTAIVGVSGAGKTTLLDLLSGLLAPDSGTIWVDGVALAELPGWRKSIAYIPQETLIQDGTLRDNLLWGNAAPTDNEIRCALEQSALFELTEKLTRGLDTPIGERGVKLSGGEKQRLALARALLRKPQLLILDEATSALDGDSHRQVLDTVRGLHGNMTILIVSHRHEELAGLIDGSVQVADGRVEPWRPAPGHR
ncbi:ATP-binding cassette domain-containing protein [Methylomonas fluvii]|uniref:ABC transporter ATP-binding protein n=1 Tax=Methylomonas fluvii TaxID=1854564 RepID=A0ABR9DH86_9GAMM|nr:ABC transporter ATP-binding protein [Methylomonas fluvii]MBD9362461.1 ABC transporter ATP-binding protein [Methylomonas fluvii]